MKWYENEHTYSFVHFHVQNVLYKAKQIKS